MLNLFFSGLLIFFTTIVHAQDCQSIFGQSTGVMSLPSTEPRRLQIVASGKREVSKTEPVVRVANEAEGERLVQVVKNYFGLSSN